jgi:hypothetical protein
MLTNAPPPKTYGKAGFTEEVAGRTLADIYADADHPDSED